MSNPAESATAFSPEQQARAEAVKVAATQLRSQNGFAAGKPGEVGEIVYLAEWIMLGGTPDEETDEADDEDDGRIGGSIVVGASIDPFD